LFRRASVTQRKHLAVNVLAGEHSVQHDDTARHRIESLDLVRGLAALAVAWFHIYQKNIQPLSDDAWIAICHYSSAHGWLGVPAFFVISGYIIPYALRGVELTPVNCGRFLWKRAIRLLPTLAFVSLIAVALAFLAMAFPAFAGPPPPFTVWNVLVNILLVAPIVGEPWILPVYWSLLVEIQYYLFIVLAMSMAVSIGARGWMALCGLLVVFPLVTPEALHSFAHWSACFAIGVAIFLHRQGLLGGVVCFAIVLAGGAVTMIVHGLIYAVPIVLTLAALYNPYAVPSPFIWLGRISYSLYLVHYLVGLRTFRLLARFAEGDWYYLLCYLLAMLASVLAAWVVFKLVEEPTMKYASSFRYRPAQMQPATA
jgi:peptidoglycan/LPS O-acetylase OafA/YrhL